MRYEGKVYRPPSEARSYVVQATIGCSHNLCTYCDMYRGVDFRERAMEEVLEDVAVAGRLYADVEKVFVADGDALVMGVQRWVTLLGALKDAFPLLRQVGCYATAGNVIAKTDVELTLLREAGLTILYIGPESGDGETLRRLVKGGTFQDHVDAAKKAHAAGLQLSVITLLGAGGVERSREHARETARLVTEMDPEYLASLTLTIIPGTPLQRMVDKGRFELPDVPGLLTELRTIIDEARPSAALFRTNHASNYVPLGGSLPQDRERLVAAIDAALSGEIPLRPESMRGL
ncbi:MAG: radical SAM protein [Gemmatimonadetes bacterium]|nr:radical SAM protein [Gemmatimonadota bacterium]MDA1103188.1 radical SAM protein [Gemmatimonadota bacterium]